MTGIPRKKAAEVIAAYFGARAVYDGGSYDAYHVTDGQGRNWKVVSDASIHPTMRDGRSASALYKVEVVSPICHYEDIETIQELVRKLRRAGACVNGSCGIHVHVDATPHSVKTLRNLVNIMVSKEDLLYKALAVDVAREDHYCQKTDLRFLEELNRKKPKSIENFERMWYHGDSRSYDHYDESRYHALNLHSVFSKGTIEFRLFNGTMHAGKVKTYIQLSLAISHQALVQKGASHQSAWKKRRKACRKQRKRRSRKVKPKRSRTRDLPCRCFNWNEGEQNEKDENLCSIRKQLKPRADAGTLSGCEVSWLCHAQRSKFDFLRAAGSQLRDHRNHGRKGSSNWTLGDQRAR